MTKTFKIKKAKIKEIAIEKVYYKENHAVLKKDNKYILRNTWTGAEEIISKEKAFELKKEWKKAEGEWF